LKINFPFVILILLLFSAILSAVLYPNDLVPQDINSALKASSWSHILGFDSLGRDYFSRVLIATRISLSVSLLSTFISFVIGVTIAVGLSKSKGFQTFLASRLVDLYQGLPSFIIVAVIMSLSHSQSLLFLSFLMGVLHWPGLARLTQAELIKIQSEPYIEASFSLGATNFHVFKKHLVPACQKLWISWFCFHLPSEIMFESSISFLGFGVQPPQVSLGVLTLEAWQYLYLKPVYMLAPAIMIFISVWSLMSLRNQTLNRKNKTSPSLT
jgi:ABC-type dipeptide/oligopeptide/nickel transport system permease subunit